MNHSTDTSIFAKLQEKSTPSLVAKRNLASCRVSILGLGTARLASLGSGHTKKDAEKLLAAAVEVGVNVIDTADTYASSACETLLGDLLPCYPERFLVSTKAGLPFVDMPYPLSLLNQFGKKLRQARRREPNFSARYIEKCIEGSLRRLRRETLDFFLLHNPVEPVWEDEALLQVLLAARAAGKIRHVGISSECKSLLQSAAKVPLFEVFQSPLQHAGAVSESLAAGRGRCIVANHLFGLNSLPEARRLAVDGVAEELGESARAVLLSYAAAHPGVAHVLTGTGNHEHLRANAAAMALKLTAEQTARIHHAGGSPGYDHPRAEERRTATA